MFVLEKDFVVAFDTDQTLVMWDNTPLTWKPGTMEFDYFGQKVYLKPHYKHISVLKSHHHRGAGVIVWSGNGWKWALEIVTKLKLEEYIDLLETKPSKFFDDLPAQEILGTHVYLKDDLEDEDWKDVVGFEGLYKVSSYGRVASYTNKPGEYIPKKLGYATAGYQNVSLSKQSKVHTKLVHRLVAEAFIPGKFDKAVVNHKDKNRQNNYAFNLEWCTQKENIKGNNKAMHFGVNHKQSKLTEQQVIDIYKRRRAGERAVDLAKEFNVSTQCIILIAKDKNYKSITSKIED